MNKKQNKAEHSRIVGEHLTKKSKHEKSIDDLNADIEKFFADGGKIQQIPSHQCTKPVANMTNSGHPLGY